MKKGLIALIAIGGILLIGFLVYYNAYNKAVALQEGVDEKWGNVQSAYQRRLDLIPNLMKTVKAAAKNTATYVEIRLADLWCPTGS
ncbi:MAG: LemA family protein [Betaproteobacteria bacterium]